MGGGRSRAGNLRLVRGLPRWSYASARPVSGRSGARATSSAFGTVTFRPKPGCSPSGSLRVGARNAGLENNSSLRNNMNSKHYPINPSGAEWLSTRAPLAPARRRFRQLRQVLAWLAVLTVPFAPACAQGSVPIDAPTLVVAPFTIAFNEWLPRGRSAIGDGLASLLITELSRTIRPPLVCCRRNLFVRFGVAITTVRVRRPRGECPRAITPARKP
jgi:hypothetical protein